MRPSNSFKSVAWVETASGDCSRDISSLVQLAGQRRERQQSKVSYLPTIFTAIYAFHIKLDHFKFYFDSFLHQNPLEYVIRRCPVKFWAQYWPSWLLRTLRKFEKNHHHLLRITTFFITDNGILQVTWPLLTNQKLKQQNKTIIKH